MWQNLKSVGRVLREFDWIGNLDIIFVVLILIMLSFSGSLSGNLVAEANEEASKIFTGSINVPVRLSD